MTPRMPTARRTTSPYSSAGRTCPCRVPARSLLYATRTSRSRTHRQRRRAEVRRLAGAISGQHRSPAAPRRTGRRLAAADVGAGARRSGGVSRYAHRRRHGESLEPAARRARAGDERIGDANVGADAVGRRPRGLRVAGDEAPDWTRAIVAIFDSLASSLTTGGTGVSRSSRTHRSGSRGRSPRRSPRSPEPDRARGSAAPTDNRRHGRGGRGAHTPRARSRRARRTRRTSSNPRGALGSLRTDASPCWVSMRRRR
jgi:hypothetical protein